MTKSNSTPLRKRLAELAFLLFLLSVAPVVYAAAEIERKDLRRAPITRVMTQRRRSRALYRHYGTALPSPFVFQILSIA